MKWIGYLIVIALGIIFVLIGMFNSQNVAFNYLLATRDVPLVVVMIISFVFGALLAWVVFGVKALYWRRRAHKIEDQIARERRAAHHDEVKSQFEAETSAS